SRRPAGRSSRRARRAGAQRDRSRLGTRAPAKIAQSRDYDQESRSTRSFAALTCNASSCSCRVMVPLHRVRIFEKSFAPFGPRLGILGIDKDRLTERVLEDPAKLAHSADQLGGHRSNTLVWWTVLA